MWNQRLIRDSFPFLSERIRLDLPNRNQRERIFLDNTASTQMPLQVIEQIARSLFTYANIHRGEYDSSQISTEDFERAYNITANLVNARSWREIIFGRNTTEMINLVMRTTADDYRNGDNVVATRLEHNSNYVPWFGMQQMLQKKGVNVEIRLVDFDKRTGEIDMSQLERLVDDRTKIVTATGASNFMGVRPDLRRIGTIAHESGYAQPHGIKGSYFLVDAAQLVPGTPVDVQDIDCDFLAWSFHKMSLPLGVGGLYARKEIISGFDPFLFGGDMIKNVKEGEVEYKELPWIYTAGTPNILGTIATGYGITFMINVGLGNLVDTNAGDAERTETLAKQIETQIIMNTPRGDFETRFTVPEEHAAVWKKYLQANPGKLDILKDADKRLAAAQRTVRTAMGNIQSYEETLTQYTIDRLAQAPGVTMYGPQDAHRRAGLIAFNIK